MCIKTLGSCLLSNIAYLCKKESMYDYVKKKRQQKRQEYDLKVAVVVCCEACGKHYSARPADIKRGWAKYCSRSCSMKAKMVALGPIKAQKAADKHFQDAINKFGNQVVFPKFAPKSIDEKFSVFCETHGNIEISLSNIKDNKFACPDCGIKKIIVKDGQKKCSKCSEWRELDQYNRDGKYRDGRVKLAAHCKCCDKARALVSKESEKRKHQIKAAGSKNRAKRNGAFCAGKIEYTKVFDRDKWRCRHCGCKVQKHNVKANDAAELDHIVPLSIGGPHTYSNVQTLCKSCNQSKHNRYAGQLVLCL